MEQEAKGFFPKLEQIRCINHKKNVFMLLLKASEIDDYNMFITAVIFLHR